MKAFDLGVLGGLLICATIIGSGLLLKNGTLQFVGSFFGLFLAVYSSIRYVIQAGRFALRSDAPIWGTLVPINFGLALVGFAAFGIHDWNVVKTVVAVSAVCLICGAILARTTVAHSRYVPIGFVLVLALPLHEEFSSFWMNIYVAVACLLLAVGVAELTRTDTGTHRQPG